MALDAPELPVTNQKFAEKQGSNATEGDAVVADANAGTTNVVDGTNLADPRNTELLKPTPLVLPNRDSLPGLVLTDDFGAPQPLQHNEIQRPGEPPQGEVGKVTRDSEGRVISIEYPNGKKREFGYGENGQLNRVVQPNGQTFVLKDGKWVDENDLPRGGRSSMEPGGSGTGEGGVNRGGHVGNDSQSRGDETSASPREHYGNSNMDGDRGGGSTGPREADFRNPQVNPDGTFSWETRDGSRNVAYTDGTSTRFLKDGGSVWMDDQDHITSVTNQNGDVSRFRYGPTGDISEVTENGVKYTVKDNELYDANDRPTGLKNPRVAPDGTYIVEDADGSFISKRTDNTTEIFKTDNSIIKKDKHGRITEIGYANGIDRKLEYNDKGLASFTAPDGTKITGATVKPDGTLEYTDKDGKIHTDYTSGNSNITEKTAAELNEIAKKLHDDNNWFDDNRQLRKTIAGLSTADRIALDKAYEQQYGQSLTTRLKRDANDPFQLKRDNTNEALKLMAESQLTTAVLKKFSNPDHLKRAMDDIADFKKRAADQGVPAGEIAKAMENAAKELEKSRKPPDDQLKELEKSLGKTAANIDSIANKYGVKYDEETTADGKKVRHYYVEDDKGIKLPVLDSATDNPLELERQLQEWRAQKTKSIEQNYNVEFSKDGQTDDPRGKKVDLRAPRIDELLALEKGLEHSQPSTSTRNGQPILVQFAVQPTSEADAYIGGKRVGFLNLQVQRRILFEPLDRSFQGMKNTILHEWAHNAQHNLDQHNPDVTREFYEAQGYRNVQIRNMLIHKEEQWQMRDKDGNYWAQGPGQGPFRNWTRVDDKGRPLRQDGSLASGWDDTQVAKQSNDQMADNAAVRPASAYHPNPVENGAEAIRMYRGDEASRQELFKLSPTLYNATKKFDQQDLDHDPQYGKNPDGTSKYIRLPDGTVGRNNEENRKRVFNYEETLRNPPPPPPMPKPQREQPREQQPDPGKGQISPQGQDHKSNQTPLGPEKVQIVSDQSR